MHLVRQFRVKYGWTPNELATRANLSHKVISNIESNPNHDCQRSTMISICHAFNLPPSVLFFPEEESEKRKMLSAIVSICMQYVDEPQIYDTLKNLRSHRIDVLSLQCDDPQDIVQSRGVKPSA